MKSLLETNWKNFHRGSAELKIKKDSVLSFDPVRVFCNDIKCTFKKEGVPLLRDEFGHLSEYGSDQVALLFIDWARVNAPDILKK